MLINNKVIFNNFVENFRQWIYTYIVLLNNPISIIEEYKND